MKILVISDNGGSAFPLAWMMASALLPLLVLFAARPVAPVAARPVLP